MWNVFTYATCVYHMSHMYSFMVVYIYEFICASTVIYVHTCTCMYFFVRICVSIMWFVRVYACAHACMHAYMHVCELCISGKYRNIHENWHVHTHEIYLNANHTCTHTHTRHMLWYIRIRIHAYIHTYRDNCKLITCRKIHTCMAYIHTHTVSIHTDNYSHLCKNTRPCTHTPHVHMHTYSLIHARHT
jgi:hypothetical protein